jgi:hypothetical protein
MRILIENYQYDYKDIKELAPGLENQHDPEKKVTLERVGYFYSPEVNDCIFVLPKVVLEGPAKQEKVFGEIEPRDLILFDKCKTIQSDDHKEQRDFIYNLSIWIYRAISVFKEHEYDRRDKNKKDPSIVLECHAPMLKHGQQHKYYTLLDIILALQKWNKENQNFVMFVLKNQHSGLNKINWTKTISRSQSFIQEVNNQQSVIYMNPINKHRKINFDEELLVIYYSILNFIHSEYGLNIVQNINFPLLKGSKFKRYLDGYGARRLRQIKYKYFSDKALELWNLCYDFFNHPTRVNIGADKNEYLMVKSFHVVFEAIIDELIAGDQSLPDELLDQEDGKRVDHMFKYRELVNDLSSKSTYYIGDSKYYKNGNKLDSKSVYKQFTYARNVIQWNLDLFNTESDDRHEGHIKLRDEITEGYNPIPNFFISAQQKELKAVDDIHLTKGRDAYHLNRQFENRLFDRDTFLLAHYDVNFLFVLALYGRKKESAKVVWRERVRKMFRKEIQTMLEKFFDFYAMTAHVDVDTDHYIKENFQSVIGKVFAPFDDKGDQRYYSLALRKPDTIELEDKNKEEIIRSEVQDENDALLFQLRQSFFVEPCSLGNLPYDILPEVKPISQRYTPKKYLTIHHLDNYLDSSFLIGRVNGDDHVKWIHSREGRKRDDAYNVRIGKNVHGGVTKSRDEIRHAKFAILYKAGQEDKGVWKAFRVKNIGEMPKDNMIRTGYKNPKHDKYLCYFFDEEITLGDFDIKAIIDADKNDFDSNKKDPLEKYPDGRPIYMRGARLKEFQI